ncbi:MULTISPECIES: hypothetical protein [Bacillaceae]|uniref:DUF4083 domain-containing protein n=1 Tax=Peribacillus simplex TaxID=1478 RepID=A0A109MV87_9BACI|nr:MULTISPECIES: hypothetical protein [Bacillaceae]KWW16111.1 hypothetical protein AS888_07415 [Peribacillus simplex]PJN89502.1 DUF4083 domain-containing protein [Bacillus sp. mrc49]
MSSYNIADIIYQLFFLAFFILIIVGAISFFRSMKRRKTRLDIMEKKLDDLHRQLRKSTD